MFLDLRQKRHTRKGKKVVSREETTRFEWRGKGCDTVDESRLSRSQTSASQGRAAGQIRGREESGPKIRGSGLQEELGEQRGRNVVGKKNPGILFWEREAGSELEKIREGMR